MITAQDARIMVDAYTQSMPSVESLLDEVSKHIAQEAKSGKTMLRVPPNCGDGFWSQEAFKDTQRFKCAKKILENNGFTVGCGFFGTYTCGETYTTTISWEEK